MAWRQLYKQAPTILGTRCLSSTSRSACLGSQNVAPCLHLKSLQRHLETSSLKQCSAIESLVLDSCAALNTLSIGEQDVTQGLRVRRPNISNHCLPINDKEIRDNPRIPDLKFELPKTLGVALEITTPTRNNQVTSLDTPGINQVIKITPGVEQPIKYANSTTLRMKHKRMKKHQLRRLRQRYWAEFRKQRMRKEARKKKAFEAEIAAIKKEGQDFNAEAFVKEKLAKAQQGGYMINILETTRKDQAV